VIEQHQHIKDRVNKDVIKKLAYQSYQIHEFSPVFLGLISQAFWDWIIQTAFVKRMTTSNAFHGQPSSTYKTKTLNRLITVLRA